MQQAVNAVTDDQPAPLGLQVDIARPRLDRLQQDLVDQPDNRRLLRHLGQLGAVRLDLVEQLHRILVGRLLEQPFDGFAADAQVRLDELGDLLSRREHRHDRQTRGGARFVQRIEIERIAGGDHQATVLAAHRKQRVAVDQPLRKLRQQRQVHLGRREVDIVHAHLFGHRAQGQLLADKSHLHGLVEHTRAVGLRIAGTLQLLGAKQPAPQENFARFH